MANNSVLKGTVNDYVKQNGAGGITGQGLQTILDSIIDSLGGKYQYAGVAVLTPTPTNPGTPDANVFYIASEPGTYTNFGGIVLTEGEVAVLKGSGSSWTKEVTGIASAEEVSQLGQYVENNPEWIRVVTDKDKRILYGIKTDGNFYFGAGCPPQVKEYVLGHLEVITALINSKVDKVDGKGLIDVFFPENVKFVDGPEYLELEIDGEKKILGGRKIDGTKFENAPFEMGGVKFLKLNDVEDRFELIIDKDGRIIAYRDKDGILHENVGIKTPFVDLSEYGIAKLKKDAALLDSQYINEYPNLFDGSNFKDKYLKREDDITILVIGDSLSAFHNQAPYENQANRPCQMICHNWVGELWNYLNDTIIQSDRFDSQVNAFTESGTFEDGYEMFQSPTLPYWTCDAMTNNGKKESGSLTRYSDTSGASVSFGWNLDEWEKLHFIHRKDYRAATSVTITIAQGNGKALVYDEETSSWVEANGYQFSQKIEQATEGSGYSQTLSNWRLKMKKANGASGNINLTFTASGSGYFFYWGTERWNGNRIILVNSSRGGHECVYFQDVIKNDIAGRKPDLVIVSAMLINEYGEVASHSHLTQDIVNNMQDLVLGNRSGYETELSLKAQSNNWQDFDVVVVMPHIRYEYFENESVFKKTNLHGVASAYMDEIAPVAWNKVKGMLLDNNARVIDVGLSLKKEALARGWAYRDAFASHGLNSPFGFTADTVHQNVLGSLIWAKHIAPVFDII